MLSDKENKPVDAAVMEKIEELEVSVEMIALSACLSANRAA